MLFTILIPPSCKKPTPVRPLALFLLPFPNVDDPLWLDDAGNSSFSLLLQEVS